MCTFLQGLSWFIKDGKTGKAKKQINVKREARGKLILFSFSLNKTSFRQNKNQRRRQKEKKKLSKLHIARGKDKALRITPHALENWHVILELACFVWARICILVEAHRHVTCEEMVAMTTLMSLSYDHRYLEERICLCSFLLLHWSLFSV